MWPSCRARPVGAALNRLAIVKAIALTEFGDTDVLAMHDLPDPNTGPDRVVIKVRAAGVNPVDTKIRAGQLQGGFPHHFPLVPGGDAAGEGVAVGPAVTRFAVGDEVMTYCRKDHIQWGTYAELVTVREDAVAANPTPLTYIEAPGLRLGGVNRW